MKAILVGALGLLLLAATGCAPRVWAPERSAGPGQHAGVYGSRDRAEDAILLAGMAVADVISTGQSYSMADYLASNGDLEGARMCRHAAAMQTTGEVLKWVGIALSCFLAYDLPAAADAGAGAGYNQAQGAAAAVGIVGLGLWAISTPFIWIGEAGVAASAERYNARANLQRGAQGNGGSE